MEKTYLILFGFEMPVVPPYFYSTARVDNIHRSGTNFTADGPYYLGWKVGYENLSYLNISINFAEYKKSIQTYTNYTWVHMDFTPATDHLYIPRNLDAVLYSTDPDLPFNRVNLTASARTRLNIAFGDVSENTTYAVMEFTDLPAHIYLSLKKVEREDGNLTTVDYRADSTIGRLIYDEFTFFTSNISGIANAPFKSVHFGLAPLPQNLYVKGAFEVEPMPPPRPFNFNPNSPFVAQVVDNILYRVTARTQWAGRVVSSIPDKIPVSYTHLTLPTKA